MLASNPVLHAQNTTKINNKEHAGYIKIPGTQIKIELPDGYYESNRFNGYENQLAEASIMIFMVPGNVNDNLAAFQRNKDISKGMVVTNEEMYRINGCDALLQSGLQFAYGKTYMRYILVIGDMRNTYVLNASWVKDSDSDKEAERIKKSLLSVIYMEHEDVNIARAFNFSINHQLGNLKTGNILMNSLVYTDDGQMPSQTDAKTIFMVNQTSIPAGESHHKYMQKILDSYPIKYSEHQDIKPKEIEIGGLSGLECFGIGTNTKLGKSELIYVVILFDGTTVYQLTGSSLKNYEEVLDGFKKMARSFRLNH